MDKELEFEYDLANLALKGKRFKEAENKYLDIARKSNSSVSWCGVGLSKLGLIIDNESTVDEVFYCFNKAKTVDNTTINEVETFVLQNSFEIIKTLYSYFIQAHNLEEEAKKQKVMGVITVVASSFLGAASSTNDRQPSLYADLTALGGTALGYKGYSDGKLKQLEAGELKLKLASLIDETKTSVISFVKNQTDALEEFKQATNKLAIEFSNVISHGGNNLMEDKKVIYLKSCQIIEQYTINSSKIEVFEKASSTISFIGTVLKEDFDEGYLEGKVKYWGLNTAWLKIYIQELNEQQCMISVGANDQDILSAGAKKAIQKFKLNFPFTI